MNDPRPGRGTGAQAGVAILHGGEARVLAGLLADVGDLPSTPPPIAAEARDRAADLGQFLPPHSSAPHAGGREPDPTVVMPTGHAVRIAGLLELLSGLPSTPPELAADIAEHARRIWAACGQEG